MNELKIEYLNPADLTPYENNTRKHAPDDIEGIKKSILDGGFNDPIGIWGKNNLIVEGHGRQIAALELHLDKVPVIRLDHMTETQRKEYAIRHNRSAEMSTWDMTTLEEELAGLEIEGVDMTDLNFDFGNTDSGEMEYFGDERERTYKGVNLKEFDSERSDLGSITPGQPRKLIAASISLLMTISLNGCGMIPTRTLNI